MGFLSIKNVVRQYLSNALWPDGTPSLNRNRTEIRLLSKSTTGNGLLLSEILWNFADA